MLRFLSITIVSAFLVGCAASPPTAEQLANADYGTPIAQADAEAKATAWLKTVLKDPESAQIDWGRVEQGWARHAPIDGGGLMFGYRMDAQINARNGFGGYTGYKAYLFIFKNGELKNVWGQQTLRSGYASSDYMGRLK